MKFIFTLAIFSLTLLSCNTTKESTEIEKTTLTNKVMRPLPTKIEFETVSRGYYKNVVITNGTAIVKENRDDVGKNIKLTTDDLQALKSAYNQFELENVNEILSPSNKRFSDASTASSIKITSDNKEYISNDFDTNNPPLEYVALVKLFGNIISKK